MIPRFHEVEQPGNLLCVDVPSFADLGGLAVEAPVAMAYMGPGAGLAAFGAFLAALGVAVFMVIGFVWYPLQRLRAASRRRRGKVAAPATKSQASFSSPDRLLHHMAFRTIPLQKALADLEDHLYAERIANVGVERPVFITSLPRAGTTILLECLCSSRAFAAHTYRNMPFLFIPLLWSAISRRFRLADTAESRVERTQGDGLKVGYDSAEAFEEAFWHAFHPAQYLPDRVLPWLDDSDLSCDFDAFFKNHIRKLISLRISERGRRGGCERPEEGVPRYISKNNGNLARLPAIRRLFPDAKILIPVRNPIAHVGSLLRTHTRFMEIHTQDAFARRYMEDIGHFDFGANLRPIDFNHWLDGAKTGPSGRANHWLAYWCAAFGNVLANLDDHIVLVDYDGLCERPVPHLERIARKVALPKPAALAQTAVRFHAPSSHDSVALEMDEVLLERTSVLHQQLLAHCRD